MMDNYLNGKDIYTTIGDTGMCSYQCDNDFVLVRDRPQGTVIERTYEMNLIEEREN